MNIYQILLFVIPFLAVQYPAWWLFKHHPFNPLPVVFFLAVALADVLVAIVAIVWLFSTAFNYLGTLK